MKTLLLMLTLAGAAQAAPIQEAYAQKLCVAIWHAEGGNKAKVSHGVLSVPTRSPEHAQEVCLRTIRNNWTRWEAAGRPGDFLDFLGARYAPLGAKNDLKGLNRNWIRNVRYFLSESLNVRSRYSVKAI